MIVKLDENNYFTMNYAIVGSIEGGIEIKELPPYEDTEKQMSCKYENGQWVFDEKRYQEIKNRKNNDEVLIQIKELQTQLNETDYKIVKCSEYQLAGLELPYDVATLHKERQAIRDKINELQASI